jgi:hypothetical protein
LGNPRYTVQEKDFGNLLPQAIETKRYFHHFGKYGLDWAPPE